LLGEVLACSSFERPCHESLFCFGNPEPVRFCPPAHNSRLDGLQSLVRLRGGDTVALVCVHRHALALKGNQGTLLDDVVLLLDDAELQASASQPVVEADHGRIETRTARVSTEIDWLQKQHQWPGLKDIG
jgi:hypothetical protein